MPDSHGDPLPEEAGQLGQHGHVVHHRPMTIDDMPYGAVRDAQAAQRAARWAYRWNVAWQYSLGSLSTFLAVLGALIVWSKFFGVHRLP